MPPAARGPSTQCTVTPTRERIGDSDGCCVEHLVRDFNDLADLQATSTGGREGRMEKARTCMGRCLHEQERWQMRSKPSSRHLAHADRSHRVKQDGARRVQQRGNGSKGLKVTTATASPMPGKMNMLLHCDAYFVSPSEVTYGGKGDPDANTHWLSVQV